MTKQLDEFFNIRQSDSINDMPEPGHDTVSLSDVLTADETIYQPLTLSEKIAAALPAVGGLDAHDDDMDEIARRAVKTFDDLIILGGNVSDRDAGKIYEVAGQMLRTAMDAKNAKSEKKLRMVELQLKKIRSEQIDFENGMVSKSPLAVGGEFDRNELLKFIVKASAPTDGREQD